MTIHNKQIEIHEKSYVVHDDDVIELKIVLLMIFGEFSKLTKLIECPETKKWKQ